MNMMTAIIAPPAMHPHMLRRTPPIALLRALPPGLMAESYGRLRRLADLFASFDRDDMEAGVELLLAELDARDGHPDEDTGNAEDEGLTGRALRFRGGPGCELSDGQEAAGDELDAAWLERLDQTKVALPRKLAWQGVVGLGTPEDAEADGDEEDTGGAEDEFPAGDDPVARYWGYGPGCPIADAPEPTRGAPERFSGDWKSNMGSVADGEGEAADQAVTLNPDFNRVAANA